MEVDAKKWVSLDELDRNFEQIAIPSTFPHKLNAHGNNRVIENNVSLPNNGKRHRRPYLNLMS